MNQQLIPSKILGTKQTTVSLVQSFQDQVLSCFVPWFAISNQYQPAMINQSHYQHYSPANHYQSLPTITKHHQPLSTIISNHYQSLPTSWSTQHYSPGEFQDPLHVVDQRRSPSRPGALQWPRGRSEVATWRSHQLVMVMVSHGEVMVCSG